MPRRAKPNARGKNFTVRLSPAEREGLELKASAAGCTLATFARRAWFGAGAMEITAAPVIDHQDARRLAFEVNKVGVNLNQIARVMNEHRLPPPPDLADVLETIRGIMRKIETR